MWSMRLQMRGRVLRVLDLRGRGPTSADGRAFVTAVGAAGARRRRRSVAVDTRRHLQSAVLFPVIPAVGAETTLHMSRTPGVPVNILDDLTIVHESWEENSKNILTRKPSICIDSAQLSNASTFTPRPTTTKPMTITRRFSYHCVDPAA